MVLTMLRASLVCYVQNGNDALWLWSEEKQKKTHSHRTYPECCLRSLPTQLKRLGLHPKNGSVAFAHTFWMSSVVHATSRISLVITPGFYMPSSDESDREGDRARMDYSNKMCNSHCLHVLVLDIWTWFAYTTEHFVLIAFLPPIVYTQHGIKRELH